MFRLIRFYESRPPRDLYLTSLTSTDATSTMPAPETGYLGYDSRLGAFKAIAPHLPNLLLKSTTHFLSLTPQSRCWDLRTTLIVEFLRGLLVKTANITVEMFQNSTTRQQKVDLGAWKVDVQIPVDGADGESAENLVRTVIEELGDVGIGQYIPKVGAESLTGEWVGNRKTAPGEERDEAAERRRENLSEKEKYDGLMKEVEGGEGSGVVLWLHGGMFFYIFLSFLSFIISLSKTV